MRSGFVTAFAALLALAGCSAAERRAESPMAEEPATSASPGPDHVDNMVEAPDDPNATANAMENASGNATDNGGSNVAVPPGPAYCPILKRTVSSDDCASITAQADNLEAGMGAFEAPATMVLNQPSPAKFAVGAAADAAETTARVGGSIAKTIQVKTKLGRYMTAKLAGPGFKIVGEGTPERDLGASGEELWTWQVTPERKGKLELLLTVSVEAADAQGQRTRIKLATKAVPVEVTVTRADSVRAAAEQSAVDAELAARVSKAWASFFTNLGLLVIAFGGAGGAIWYFKFRKPADPTVPPAPPKDKPGDKE